jgi:aspartate aminotransferase
VFVPTREEEGFAPTASALERALTPRTRAVVVNSPCNPTGALVTGREWEAIAEIARGRDLIVISDEVYESFVYDGERFVSGSVCLPGLKDRLVVVSAVSKSYAMTGWRPGIRRRAARPDQEAAVQSHDASQASTVSQTRRWPRSGAGAADRDARRYCGAGGRDRCRRRRGPVRPAPGRSISSRT